MADTNVTAPGTWTIALQAEFDEGLIIHGHQHIQVTVIGVGDFDVGVLAGYGDQDTGTEGTFEVPEAVVGVNPGTFWRPGPAQPSTKPTRIRGRSDTATIMVIDAS
jgi:hypothetical protein